MAILPRTGHTRRDFLRLLASAAGAWLLGPNTTRASNGDPFVVPPTLMLHPRDTDKGQLPHLLAWLTEAGYQTIHYADLARAIRGETTLPERTMLLTLDDLGSHWVAPQFYGMADLIEEAGHRASFGIVTRDAPDRSPGVWQTIRGFAERGFEMNTHTHTHCVLTDLESMDDIHEEIVGSTNMIADALGVRPVSLIAPYGDVYVPDRHRVLDQRIFDVALEAGLELVAGIVQGRTIPPDMRAPYYVGRSRVGVDAYQTQWWLEHFYDA